MPLSAFVVKGEALTPANATLMTLIIWGICLGVFAGACWSVLHRRVAGAPVRAMLALEAFEEAKALTLEELGLSPRSLAHRALQKNSALKALVKTVTDQEGTVRYFLPEELRYRAAIRYEVKGNPAISLLFTGVLCLALGLLLVFLVPLALTMAKSLS